MEEESHFSRAVNNTRRSLSGETYAAGVNWYLAPDENHNADGKHTAYLRNYSDKFFDEELYNTLKSIIDSGNRNVQHIQDSSILPKQTVFYDRVLDFSSTEDYLVRQRLRHSAYRSHAETTGL